MFREMTYNDTVCEALALALLRLMQNKNFEQITISEIVKLAGVSRSSFYRNFESKEQILFEYIRGLYQDFFRAGDVPERQNSADDFRTFLLPRFRFIKEHSLIFSVLVEHNMLYEFFRQTEQDLILLLCGQNESVSPYHRAMYSGACAGVIRLWYENDFLETEEEMVSLFLPRI